MMSAPDFSKIAPTDDPIISRAKGLFLQDRCHRFADGYVLNVHHTDRTGQLR
jgi:hypothetical protein